MENVRIVGTKFRKGLEKMQLDRPKLLKQVRGRGLMLGVEFDASVPVSKVVDLCRQRGIFVLTAGNNTLRIVPPLVIGPREVERGLEVLREVVSIVDTR